MSADNPAENKIDYLEIPVGDIEQSKQFFSSLFAWQFKDYGPDYTAFDDGKTKGGLFLSDTRFSVECGCPLIVFYRSDIEAARVDVLALKGGIVKEIFAFPGGRRFHFSDLNGNEYAIWSDC